MAEEPPKPSHFIKDAALEDLRTGRSSPRRSARTFLHRSNPDPLTYSCHPPISGGKIAVWFQEKYRVGWL